MAQNAIALGARYVVVDLVGGVILFPVWWYSRGLLRMGEFVARSIRAESRSLGILVWLKNIFVPMYAAYDIWGRIISFLMRGVQIIGRTIFLLVYVVLMVALFLAYVILPVVIVWQFLFHLLGRLFFVT